MGQDKRHVVVGVDWCGGMLHGSIIQKMILREHRRFCRQRGGVLMSSSPIGVIRIPSTLLLTRRAGSVWGDVVWRPSHRDMITVTGQIELWKQSNQQGSSGDLDF